MDLYCYCYYYSVEMSCGSAEPALVSPADFEITCRVLHLLGQDQNREYYESPDCRPIRHAIQPLFNIQKEKMFAGISQREYTDKRSKKIRNAQAISKQKQEDKEYLKKTALRAGRIKKLEEVSKSHDGMSVPMILDGVGADDGDMHVNSSSVPKMIEQAEMNDATTEGEEPVLNSPRCCYTCKKRYYRLHHFYDTLCEVCAELNWVKRLQTCNLKNRICLVTGGRVKIGFQCCLKLLRAGAIVISTSRFPADSAARYAALTDFDEWKHRLHIIGIDLRDIAAIEYLCSFVENNFPWLDVIINNVSFEDFKFIYR
jgi:hypothetical protein